MKNVIFFFIITLFLSFFSIVNSYAATSTPSPAELQIDELKDKIASRVAQLKLVEKRGVIGKVSDISDTQIALSDIKGDTRFIDVDELTKFHQETSSSESFGISDIKKGDTLGALGLYNKQSRRILARSIYQMTLSKMIHGYIAQADSDNFVLTVAADNNDQFEVSVETTTKSFAYDKVSQDLVRTGFSKLKEGEKVFATGTLDKKNDKLISTDAIIVFPDITKGIKPQLSPSAIPSTGSGKKITPIIK